MSSRSLQGIFSLLVVATLLFLASCGPNTQITDSINRAEMGVNAQAMVIGTIYTQPVDPSGTLLLSAWLDPDGSDLDQYIWDNFTLPSNETITEIAWFGVYDPLKFGAGGPVLDFTVAIYPSIAAGTEPAVAGQPLVEYQTGGNAGETPFGMIGTATLYAYAFSLPTPFAASAGVKYWVQIEASQQGSAPDWSLAAGADGNGSHFRRTSGAGGDIMYRTAPGDAAFTLLGLVPDTPTDISLSNSIVDENQPVNTVVGALTAISPDPNATFTFSLTCAAAGVDDGSFSILGTNLQTSAIFDFETKSAYNICLRVTDQGGLTFDKDFIITVKDVNEAPTDISLSNTTVDENQLINTVVGTLTAADPDAGATFTFILGCAVAGADDASFNILGANLRTSATFDFETKPAYNICLHVTDQGGLTLDKNFVVSLNDLNEAPTDISLSNTTVDENQPANMVVGALTATDQDAAATFTFSLACAGADNSAFNILGTNLQTSATLDFESKSVYNICVRVTDQGGLTFDKSFVVTVNNVIEAPMDIFLSANSVNENQPVNTAVGTLTATDPEPNPTFTFNLTCAVPGMDDSAFNILGTNLRTSATFDFESKSSYSICIRVTNQGGLTFDRNFAIIVNNLNEAPTEISLSNTAVDENQPVNTMVGALSAIDPDAGATFTFSLACAVAGADDGSFNILGANLQASASFDFEMKTAYSICLRVTDQGGLSFDKSFIVTVNNVNETPTDISLSNTAVAENQPINTAVGTLSAVDPDAAATFTFSLTCGVAGTDDLSFNILGTNLQTSATFDFETKSAYSICLRVTDQGGLTFDKNFVITVNNLSENAAPTDISLSNATVDENQPVNTVVGALTATDPDAGATFTFSLGCTVAGADDASFNILGTNLQTSAIFDFETKSTYTICIRVTDQGGLTFDKNFVITVKDVIENAAPTDILLSNNTVDENQPVNTVVGTLTATDPDAGATFTFSLACAAAGPNDASFNILGTNLRTTAIFDFETKSAYSICIRVTDQGGLTFDKNFVVTVNNLNESPTGISLSNNTVDENQPINTVVGTLAGTDPDAGATFTFSLACTIPGADDASFNILGTDLRTSAPFDFETKSTYSICIRVTDQGGLTFDKNFVVTVNDLYDPTNTPGKVTGGGNIGSEQGKDKITFGFNISYEEGDAEPKGNLTYQDHEADLRLKVTSFDLLVIEGDHAWFTGTGIVNDGLVVTFTVEIDALSRLGQPDMFKIFIPALNGYAAGGALTGGNITIH